MGKARALHEMKVPDLVWNEAKRLSGLENPAPWIRDEWLLPAMVASIARTNGARPAAQEQLFQTAEEARWAQMGMQKDQFDLRFGEARDYFCTLAGTETLALEFFEDHTANKGMHTPRAWLMSWYSKQTPEPANT